MLGIAIEVTVANKKGPKDVVQIYGYKVSSLRPPSSERHDLQEDEHTLDYY